MKRKAGISIAVSAVIISAAILTITIIAAFVSTNILELQMQSSEFEQAKSNMMLLSDYIDDVGLKRGSGGTVRFNMRTGGFGVENRSGQLFVTAEGEWNSGKTWGTTLIGSLPALVDSSMWGSLLTAYTRGGSLVSVGFYPVVLKGNASAPWLVTGMADSLAFLVVNQTQGARVSLDYNRVRVLKAGTVIIDGKSYYFVEVTFLRLVKGQLSGSGSMNIKVQNTGVLVRSASNDYGPADTLEEVRVTARFGVGPAAPSGSCVLRPPAGTVGLAYTVTVATVEIGSV